jgi:hypothetical protein
LDSAAPDPAEFTSPDGKIDPDQVAPLAFLRHLGEDQMKHLRRVVFGATDDEVQPVDDVPLYGPPNGNGFLSRLPENLERRLAQMSESELAALGDALGFGTRLSQQYVVVLARLAKKAVGEERHVFGYGSR